MADDDISNIVREPATKRDDTIAALEARLEKERDARKEERFCFIVGLVIMFNFVTFPSMQTWGAPIAILALETVVLLGVAKQCGVDYVAKLIDMAAGYVFGKADRN